MRHLKTTTHWILALVLCSGILSAFQLPPTLKSRASFYATETPTDTKSAAFGILNARCNGCHVKQNPGKVFTPANMNSLASDINEQVFIRKRMPRGNRVRLTESDYHLLRNWLITQNLN